jgi:cell division protein FtsW
MAGLHWLWVAGIGGIGAIGAIGAYKFLPHVRVRIDKFLNAGDGVATNPGNSFQSDIAVESFVQGGWLGKGPGEGTLKRILPDSHTDFIFAVAGEEFGLVACLFLLSVFAFIVLRGFLIAARNEDPFCRFATAGLVMLFGLQSAINMAVNLHLVPAKGMTLPFISYGGSSLLSLAIAMGFLIAVTRRRPRSEIFERVE